jgi:hypothetical protein
MFDDGEVKKGGGWSPAMVLPVHHVKNGSAAVAFLLRLIGHPAW